MDGGFYTGTIVWPLSTSLILWHSSVRSVLKCPDPVLRLPEKLEKDIPWRSRVVKTGVRSRVIMGIITYKSTSIWPWISKYSSLLQPRGNHSGMVHAIAKNNSSSHTEGPSKRIKLSFQASLEGSTKPSKRSPVTPPAAPQAPGKRSQIPNSLGFLNMVCHEGGTNFVVSIEPCLLNPLCCRPLW